MDEVGLTHHQQREDRHVHEQPLLCARNRPETAWDEAARKAAEQKDWRHSHRRKDRKRKQAQVPHRPAMRAHCFLRDEEQGKREEQLLRRQNNRVDRAASLLGNHIAVEGLPPLRVAQPLPPDDEVCKQQLCRQLPRIENAGAKQEGKGHQGCEDIGEQRGFDARCRQLAGQKYCQVQSRVHAWSGESGEEE
eukprot:1113553-Prymnesium_polylepis.2